MIDFVNAKINIGLQIVGKREDGYHNLQTVFYPIGKKAGLPSNPTIFCDILEIIKEDRGKTKNTEYIFSGKKVDCPEEQNLVCRAVNIYREVTGFDAELTVTLDKHLPDGAGIGGGSADAAFTLRMLSQIDRECRGIGPDDRELADMALKLGADCPFFIYNRPMVGEGIGEKLCEIKLNLEGYWLLLVKPEIRVSTKEAFSGIVPKATEFDLSLLPSLQIEEWQGIIKNDFEESIFPKFPKLSELKHCLIESGAMYASMTGSGSALYGIYRNQEEGEKAKKQFEVDTTLEGVYLLKL